MEMSFSSQNKKYTASFYVDHGAYFINREGERTYSNNDAGPAEETAAAEAALVRQSWVQYEKSWETARNLILFACDIKFFPHCARVSLNKKFLKLFLMCIF